MAAFSGAASKHLVLHVDINNTIVAMDTVQGYTHRDSVSTFLTDLVWGSIDTTKTGVERWIPVLEPQSDSSSDPPRLLVSERQPAPNTYTYMDFTNDHLFPEAKDSTETFVSTQKVAKDLRRRFVEAGQPGESLASEVSALVSHMESQTNNVFDSFFNLLTHLDKNGTSYQIVLRSFGTDHPEVVDAINSWCRGKHPSFPDVRMDGTSSSPNRVVEHNDKFNGPKIVSLRFTSEGEEGMTVIEGLDLGGGVAEDAGRHTGAAAVDKYRSLIRGTDTVAINDDYHWWNNHKRDGAYAKLMLIDEDDKDTIQLFFDDNVKRDRLNVVNARYAKSSKRASFEKVADELVHNKLALRVEPYFAMRNPNYFIDLLSDALKGL